MRISKAVAIFASEHVYGRVREAGCQRVLVVPAGAYDGRGLSAELALAEGDLAWSEFLHAGRLWSKKNGACAPHICMSGDCSNILFSSGTTGEPKAIPWSHTTPIRCAADAFAHHDVRERDVVCWPTNLGWMMGPWLVYAALLNGAAIALFHGSPIDRQFPRFVEQARVTMLGLVPTMVNAWRLSRVVEGCNWRRIRCFSSSGEASSPDAYHWLMSTAG